RAFELFLAMAGDDGVRELLLLARGGATFEDAFSTVTGVSVARFEKDAIRARFSRVSFGRKQGAGSD
ncbi:MAG: hypothetical protein ACJ79G_08365, partial [Myxococcales bacterium]